jgi:hypothetical protein
MVLHLGKPLAVLHAPVSLAGDGEYAVASAGDTRRMQWPSRVPPPLGEEMASSLATTRGPQCSWRAGARKRKRRRSRTASSMSSLIRYLIHLSIDQWRVHHPWIMLPPWTRLWYEFWSRIMCHLISLLDRAEPWLAILCRRWTVMWRRGIWSSRLHLCTHSIHKISLILFDILRLLSLSSLLDCKHALWILLI